MNRNILSILFDELHVKYTKKYLSELIEGHPYKYNLYGFSQILTMYHVENKGVQISKDDIELLDAPFIAYAGHDIVVVKNLTREKIEYYWQRRWIQSSLEAFCEIWDRIVLLTETSSKSIEPDYKQHKWQELVSKIKKGAISVLLFILLFLCMPSLWVGTTYSWMYLIINFMGMGVSYLLLQKQLHAQSLYGDKICTLFHQKDCNTVLESDAANFMGLFSWSEIGFGYFMSNIIGILFSPELIFYMVWVNILALPYTIWSVWYQSNIARQWCVLCLIVQCLLWCLFFVDLGFNMIAIPVWNWRSLLLVMCMYLFSILLMNQIVQVLTKLRQYRMAAYELASIKVVEEVFVSLLKKEPHYYIDRTVSKMILGNSDASLCVTVLTNPHCEPCGKMHRKIENLLMDVGDRMCVQYIFSAFNDELLISNQFLIAVYLQYGEEKGRRIYEEWFTRGKYTAKDYIKKFNLDINSADVLSELEHHQRWKIGNHLSATPTILVNGYKLPKRYQIEDLVYLANSKLAELLLR